MTQKNGGKKYLQPKKQQAEDEQVFGNERSLSLSHTYARTPLLGRSLLIRVTNKS